MRKPDRITEKKKEINGVCTCGEVSYMKSCQKETLFRCRPVDSTGGL